jgi:ferric-chelate reductase
MLHSPGSINTHIFVFHINVVLLCLFALYVIWTLPRALVHLFQHDAEFLTGSFLRVGSGSSSAVPRTGTTSHHRSDTHGNSSATNTPISQTVPALVHIPENGVGWEKDESSEAQCPALIIPPRAAAAADFKGSTSRRVPTLFLRWMWYLRPTLAYTLNFRIAPGISLGKVLVFLVYNALMLYASLRRSNPLTNPHRLGYLAISQVPFAVALAGKTNWPGLACGLGYEKV